MRFGVIWASLGGATRRSTGMELLADTCCELERNRVSSIYRQFVSAVVEAGELARHSGSDEEFYQQLLELAVDVVPGAQAGSIQLAIAGTTRFRFIAAVGFELAKLQLNELDRSEFYRSVDVPTAQIVQSIGVQSDDPEVIDWMSDAGRADDIKSTLSVPVIVDGETVAFGSLDNFDDFDAFDETSLEMMTVLGRFIGDLYVRRRLEAQLSAEREALRLLATRDPLTGLVNRREFDHLLAALLKRTSPAHRPSAVLFVDLDDFKLINDTHGHDAGDEVLRTVASRIEGAIRSGDVAARWGGDEFLVLLARADRPEGASLVAERILHAFDEPILFGDIAVSVSVSIGVGWSFDSQLVSEQLLAVADEALYEAKSDNKGLVRLKKA